MSFRFPYQYGYVDKRKIPYPLVPVTLKTTRGLRTYSFIMDTGADMLTMPNYMITLLGIPNSSLKQSLMQGIGQDRVDIWEGIIKIFFCNTEFSLRCSFTGNDRTPLLLGKEGIFSRFNIAFDNYRHCTFFEEIGK